MKLEQQLIKLELRNEAVIRWVDLSRRLTKFIPSPGDNLHAEKISNWRVISQMTEVMINIWVTLTLGKENKCYCEAAQ